MAKTAPPPTPAEIAAAMTVLGRVGGSVSSERKTAANRANARKRWADVRAAQQQKETSK